MRRSSSRFILAGLTAGLVTALPILAASADQKPVFLVGLMPPEACLAAPTKSCLLAALRTAIEGVESDRFRADIARRHLLAIVAAQVEDPALSALLHQYDPGLTPEGVARLRAPGQAEPADPPAGAPSTPPTMAARRASVLALADRSARSNAAEAAIRAFVAEGHMSEADALFQAVIKTLDGRNAAKRSLVWSVSRTYAGVGAWTLWSKALVAGGFDRDVATATLDDAPDIDPTETVFEEPLGKGAPVETLIPWLARVKNGAYRKAMTALVFDKAFERGRISAWSIDFAAFRARVIGATARGAVVNGPGDAPLRADTGQLDFALSQALARDDRGLRLAVALQVHLGPTIATTPGERDGARDILMQDFVAALARLPPAEKASQKEGAGRLTPPAPDLGLSKAPE